MGIRNSRISIVLLVLGFATSAAGQVTESHLTEIFDRVATFSFEMVTETPQMKVSIGRTQDRGTCVVTHSVGKSVLALEVLVLDEAGNVASEPLAYELSTRRKYKSLVLSQDENSVGSQLRLQSLQALGSSARVSYDIGMKKVRGQLAEVNVVYRNWGGQDGSKPLGRDALGCLKLRPYVAVSSAGFAARANEAKRSFELSQKEKLGAYLSHLVPRCALESSQAFSCEYGYQSPRIPDYLKVTYALTSNGLGRVLNIEFTRGH